MNFNKVVELVYQSRKIITQNAIVGKNKNGDPYDFVTAADLAISDFLKNNLKKLYPDVGFVTEEESSHAYTNKYFIVDPIDGTTNLVYNYNASSISLAYVENNEVLFGVVFDPFTKELFFSLKGKGAYCYNATFGIENLLKTGIENYNKKPLSCKNRNLSQSIIEFGAGSSQKNLAQDTFDRARRIFEKCLDLRRICSSALAICYIALGRIDGYFERKIKPWDYAAAILILQEAGGISANWKGEKLPLDDEGTIICSQSNIFDEFLAIVNA